MKLGEQGEAEVVLQGEGALPGRQRKPPTAAAIERRLREFHGRDKAPAAEGITPLNAGFFQLERMRSNMAVKSRDKVRDKLRDR